MPKLLSINPSNYKVNAEVEVSGAQEVKNKVADAQYAQVGWKFYKVSARVKLLRKALSEFERRKGKIIGYESTEMGKPITAAASDFNDAMTFANWYLDNAENCLAPETTFENESEISTVYHEPRGVAAVIIPWNYPFLMFIWTAFPNLLAGNAVVLKHSEECPLCGHLIEVVMKNHLPEGVFSEVYGNGDVGQMLVNQDIDLLVFTGSSQTGKKLYELTGKKFIPAIMEMGGSAPGIVFEDADIDAAVKSVSAFRLANAGQYCDGLKRLIVHETIFDEVEEKLATSFKAMKVGPAVDLETELGPLVSKRQLNFLIKQVKNAVEMGARVVTGGHSLEKKLGGAFFEQTVLTNVTGNMRVWKEEVFGPVLPVIKFKHSPSAVWYANNTPYGLGAYVYTQDKERADWVARSIKSGMVSINGANYTMPCNPFGGYKNSGMGREHGKWGFHELTQVKVVASPK